jgi:hypothetical protein
MKPRTRRFIPNGLTLGKLFQQPENEIIMDTIKKLRTQISREFNADILLQEVNTLVQEVNPDHWTFTSPGVMIVGALIFLLIRLCCWKYWKKCCQGALLHRLPWFSTNTWIRSEAQ